MSSKKNKTPVNKNTNELDLDFTTFKKTFLKKLQNEVKHKDFTFDYSNPSIELTKTYNEINSYLKQNDKNLEDKKEEIKNEVENKNPKLNNLHETFTNIITKYFNNKNSDYALQNVDVNDVNTNIVKLKTLETESSESKPFEKKLNDDFEIVKLQEKIYNFIKTKYDKLDTKPVFEYNIDPLNLELKEINIIIDKEQPIIDNKEKYDTTLAEIKKIHDDNISNIEIFINNEFEFKPFIEKHNKEIFDEEFNRYNQIQNANKTIDKAVEELELKKSNAKVTKIRNGKKKEREEEGEEREEGEGEEVEEKLEPIIAKQNKDIPLSTVVDTANTVISPRLIKKKYPHPQK